MEMETFRVQFRARKRKITPRIAVVLADDSWRLAHWSQQRHCDIIMQLCRPLITLDISLTARITLIRPPLLFRCHCRTTMPAQTDTPPLTIATRQTTEAKKQDDGGGSITGPFVISFGTFLYYNNVVHQGLPFSSDQQPSCLVFNREISYLICIRQTSKMAFGAAHLQLWLGALVVLGAVYVRSNFPQTTKIFPYTISSLTQTTTTTDNMPRRLPSLPPPPCQIPWSRARQADRRLHGLPCLQG